MLIRESSRSSIPLTAVTALEPLLPPARANGKNVWIMLALATGLGLGVAARLPLSREATVSPAAPPATAQAPSVPPGDPARAAARSAEAPAADASAGGAAPAPAQPSAAGQGSAGQGSAGQGSTWSRPAGAWPGAQGWSPGGAAAPGTDAADPAAAAAASPPAEAPAHAEGAAARHGEAAVADGGGQAPPGGEGEAGAKVAEGVADDAGPGADLPFDKEAASSLLGGAIAKAAACRGDGEPRGSARVAITFAPSGRITQATVAGPPYAGTATGGCIARTVRDVKIRPFAGAPITVSKTVTIR